MDFWASSRTNERNIRILNGNGIALVSYFQQFSSLNQDNSTPLLPLILYLTSSPSNRIQKEHMVVRIMNSKNSGRNLKFCAVYGRQDSSRSMDGQHSLRSGLTKSPLRLSVLYPLQLPNGDLETLISNSSRRDLANLMKNT
ncbi:hypothetical protein CUMW_103570 [Citrus unshiu]|nr:hypothetical protein CUMW_103570 [Citrus unshiu]